MKDEEGHILSLKDMFQVGMQIMNVQGALNGGFTKIQDYQVNISHSTLLQVEKHCKTFDTHSMRGKNGQRYEKVNRDHKQNFKAGKFSVHGVSDERCGRKGKLKTHEEGDVVPAFCLRFFIPHVVEYIRKELTYAIGLKHVKDNDEASGHFLPEKGCCVVCGLPMGERVNATCSSGVCGHKHWKNIKTTAKTGNRTPPLVKTLKKAAELELWSLPAEEEKNGEEEKTAERRRVKKAGAGLMSSTKKYKNRGKLAARTHVDETMPDH